MANSAMTVGVAIAAAQSDQETATSTTTVVTPGRQQYHPSASKAWVRFTTVTSTAISSSYNVSGLTDNGTGDTTITFSTNFSSATSYTYSGMPSLGSSNSLILAIKDTAAAPTTSAIRVQMFNLSGSGVDGAYIGVSCFGDQ